MQIRSSQYIPRWTISFEGNQKQWISQLQFLAMLATSGFILPLLATSEIWSHDIACPKNRRKSLAFIMRCNLWCGLCFLDVAWNNFHSSWSVYLLSVKELQAKCIISFQLNSVCDSIMEIRLLLIKLVVRLRTEKITTLLFLLLISGTEMFEHLQRCRTIFQDILNSLVFLMGF